MTEIEEALDRLHRLALYEHKVTDKELAKMVAKDIKSLRAIVDHKMPKKGIIIADEGFDVGMASRLCCPSCYKPIINVWSTRGYQPKYCHNCGQKLDWRNEDGEEETNT